MVQVVDTDSSARAQYSGKSICITSRRSGEGKTAVAIRLAGALARGSMRVCLVDLGAGADNLSTRFAREPQHLKRPIPDAVAVAVAPSVDLIPAPVCNGNAVTEDSAIGHLVELLDQLKSVYDLILLDCSSDLLGWCYPLWRRMDAVVAVVCPDTMTPDLAWSVAAWIGHSDISALFLLNKAGPGGEDISRLEGVAAGIGRMRFGGSPVVLGQLFRDDPAAERVATAAFGDGSSLPDSGMDRIVGELLQALERKTTVAVASAPAEAVASPNVSASSGRFVQELAEGFVAEGVFLDHVGQLLSAYCQGFGLSRIQALTRLIRRDLGPDGVARLASEQVDAADSATASGEAAGLDLESLPEASLEELGRELEAVYRRRFDKDLHDPVADLVARIGAPDYRKEQYGALHRTLLRAYAQRFGRPGRELKPRIAGSEHSFGKPLHVATASAAPGSPDRASGAERAGRGAEAPQPVAIARTDAAKAPPTGGSVRHVPSARSQWVLALGALGLAAVALGVRWVGEPRPAPALDSHEKIAVQKPARAPVLSDAAAAAPSVAALGRQEAAVPAPVAAKAEPPEASPAAISPEPLGPQPVPHGNGNSPADVAVSTRNGIERLTVEAREDCWVSVSDRRGRTLGRDLVKAGTTRDYVGTGPLSVMLGNSLAVSVRINDAAVDLTPYQRNRVAHLTLPTEIRPRR